MLNMVLTNCLLLGFFTRKIIVVLAYKLRAMNQNLFNKLVLLSFLVFLALLPQLLNSKKSKTIIFASVKTTAHISCLVTRTVG